MFKRLSYADIILSLLVAFITVFEINGAWETTFSSGTQNSKFIVVHWLYAIISVCLIGTSLLMRVYPVLCASLTLGLLGVWALGFMSVLPENTGYPPLLLLALWAIYCVSRDREVAQYWVVIVALAAIVGSIISPLMWSLVEVGHLQYRRGEDMYGWLALHWTTIIAIVLLGWRRKTQEMLREESIQRSRAQEHLRIASEIHDVLAHSLTLIRMQAAAGLYDETVAKTNLETIHKVSGEGIAEVRMIVNALKSGNLEVPETMHLQDVVKRFELSGLYIEAEIDPKTSQCSPLVQLALHRIITETLTNALKHQGTGTSVALSVRNVAHRIEIDVQSTTPCGTSQRFLSSGGFGLTGIRERCAALGGEFEFRVQNSTAITNAWLPKDPS